MTFGKRNLTPTSQIDLRDTKRRKKKERRKTNREETSFHLGTSNGIRGEKKKSTPRKEKNAGSSGKREEKNLLLKTHIGVKPN